MQPRQEEKLQFSTEILYPHKSSEGPTITISTLPCLIDLKLYHSETNGILVGIDFHCLFPANGDLEDSTLKSLHDDLQSFGKKDGTVKDFFKASTFFKEFYEKDREFLHTAITHRIHRTDQGEHTKLSIVYQLPATTHGTSCWLSYLMRFLKPDQTVNQNLNNVTFRFVNYSQKNIFPLQDFINGPPDALSLLQSNKNKKTSTENQSKTQTSTVDRQLIEAIIALNQTHQVKDSNYIYAINAIDAIYKKHDFDHYFYRGSRFGILYPEIHVPECPDHTIKKIALNLLIHGEAHYIDYFVERIMHARNLQIKSQKHRLYRLAEGKTAADGKPYGDNHIERFFLISAEFKLIEDQFHIVNVQNNWGYKSYYLSELEPEMKHLFNTTLKYNLADDCNLNEEMIFTKEATQGLSKILTITEHYFHKIISEAYVEYVVYSIFSYTSQNLFLTLPSELIIRIITLVFHPYEVNFELVFDRQKKLTNSIEKLGARTVRTDDVKLELESEWNMINENTNEDVVENAHTLSQPFSLKTLFSRSHQKNYFWINVRLETPTPEGTCSFYITASLSKDFTISAKELETELKNKAGKNIKLQGMQWCFVTLGETKTVDCSNDLIIHYSHFTRNFLIMHLEKKPNLTITSSATTNTTTTTTPLVSQLSVLNNNALGYSCYFYHYVRGRTDKDTDALVNEWNKINLLREHILHSLVKVGMNDTLDLISKQNTALQVIKQHEDQLKEFNLTAIRMLRDQIMELASDGLVVKKYPQFENGPLKYLRACIDKKTKKATGRHASDDENTTYPKIIRFFEKLEKDYLDSLKSHSTFSNKSSLGQ